jgi:hypothetical protein
MDPLSLLTGAGGVAGVIATWFGATKGAPAVLAWVKTKWTAGAAELTTLRGDVASAHTMIANLETKVQAELELIKGQLTGVVGPVSALQTDMGALKVKVESLLGKPATGAAVVIPPPANPAAASAPAA